MDTLLHVKKKEIIKEAFFKLVFSLFVTLKE
jgi:hypothetical protein